MAAGRIAERAADIEAARASAKVRAGFVKLRPAPLPQARIHAAARGGAGLPVILQTTLLLAVANVFMTFAWSAHLKNLGARPLYVAILASWGVAFLEYCFQVPANRLGIITLTLGQLKLLQEVVTLVVFVPFAICYMQQPPQSRLPLGRPLPARRGLFHLPLVKMRSRSIASSKDA